MSFGKLFAPLLVVAAFAGGCTAGDPVESQINVVGQANSLTQLADCSTVEVDSDFTARPSGVDGFYVVLDGTREVCATDLDGLQALASRLDNALGNGLLTQTAETSSNPMPGRVSQPSAASNPMPGQGGDPAASNPMPGQGGDPAASNPMPGNTGGSRRVTQ